MADLYLLLLGQPDARIDGKTYNVGGECHTLDELVGIAKRVAGSALTIDVDPADDLRSYHLSSEKLRRELGFEPSRTVEDAIRGLVAAFRSGTLPDSRQGPRHCYVKGMRRANLDSVSE